MKKKRLLIYFCISLALSILIGVSFFYLRKLNALEKYSQRVDHSYQVIIQTNLLEKKLLNAETRQRGYLLTKDPVYLESYLAELKDIPSIFLKLDYLTSDNYRQQKNLDTLRDVINMQLSYLKHNLQLNVEDTSSQTSFKESDVYMNKIRSVIAHMIRNEDYLLVERTIYKNRNNEDSRAGSFLSLITAFALVCIAAIIIIWFFNRNEIYRADLEEKLQKLTSLNHEIKELIMAGGHNLQEPMRKVQMIIDRLQHVSGSNDLMLNEQLNRVKDIYSKQQQTNSAIVDYYNILLADEKKQNIHLEDFILGLAEKNYNGAEFKLVVDKLPSVEADPTHLELLFKNVINNSIRFRDKSRALEIHIHTVPADASVVGAKLKNYDGIAISDNGSGVAPEYLPKIFELFRKIETPDSGLHHGMGLSFCRRIMQNHNGWISAQANSPHGLSILLFFPKIAKV